MRLSMILELLLIFLIIAFSAYARTIERDVRAIQKKQSAVISSAVSLKQATESVNKYCVCNEHICNCCRDFEIPLLKLPGPGCASLQYIPDGKLAMQLSVGENILSTNIINGKNPKPVCVNLPGGFSKFCGKIYNIQKEEDKHFKACLGLELLSVSDQPEAFLRVSCFRFGPDGLKLRPAEQYPALAAEPSTASSDDDYDDLFGLDDDDEDDEDDEDYEKADSEQPQNQESQDVDREEEEDEDDDILGLGALYEILTGADETPAKKKPKTTTTTTPIPSAFQIPIIMSTKSPAAHAVSRKPAATVAAAAAPVEALASSTVAADVQKTPSESATVNDFEAAGTTVDPFEDSTKSDNELEEDSTASADFGVTEAEEPVPAASNKIAPASVPAPTPIVKVNPKPAEKPTKIAKPHVAKKKVSITSQSVNAINDVKKPAQQHHQHQEDDDDQDDDYDYSDSSDVEDENDEDEEDEKEEHDEKNEESDKNAEDDEATHDEEEYEDDDDDEEEEEDAVLSALVGGSEDVEKETEQKKDKKKASANKPSSTKKTPQVHDDDNDYDGLAELLARNHPARTAKVNDKVEPVRSARQSKVMRL